MLNLLLGRPGSKVKVLLQGAREEELLRVGLTHDVLARASHIFYVVPRIASNAILAEHSASIFDVELLSGDPQLSTILE